MNGDPDQIMRVGITAFTWLLLTLMSTQKREVKHFIERRDYFFKTFMAYKGALMIDDRQMIGLDGRSKKQGGLVTVHATNGDMIDYLVAKHRAEGKLSPSLSLFIPTGSY
jgi:dihydropyrimidinase